MELKVCFLGAVRFRTFICCRNVRISASSAARDRNRSATIQTMSLTTSLIPEQHRPILDQLLVRLSLRYGQVELLRSHYETRVHLRSMISAISGSKDCTLLGPTYLSYPEALRTRWKRDQPISS